MVEVASPEKRGQGTIEGLQLKKSFSSISESDQMVAEHFEKYFKVFLSNTTCEELEELKPIVKSDGFEGIGDDLPKMSTLAVSTTTGSGQSDD